MEDTSSVKLTNPAKRKGVYCEIREVDADLAAEWLENNVSNRRVRSSRVHQYSDAISRNEWILGGTMIAFDHNGKLINGQHTLLAIVDAKKFSVPVIVVYNLEPEAYNVIDQVTPRTMGDILQAGGEASTVTLASALNWLYRFQLYKDGKTKTPVASGGLTPTKIQLQELLEENPDIRNSVGGVTNRAARSYRIPHGGMVYLHYEMSLVSTEKADEFFAIFANGEYPEGHRMEGHSLGARNPIRALRRTLQDNLGSRSRFQELHVMALVIKTANFWYSGKEASVVKFLSSEEYPTLKWKAPKA